MPFEIGVLFGGIVGVIAGFGLARLTDYLAQTFDPDDTLDDFLDEIRRGSS